jgi:hypothetical protein
MTESEQPVSVKCPGCNTDLGLNFTNKFCPNCGYPVNESPAEQKKFVGRLKVMRLEFEEELKKINRVRIFLFVIAGILVVSGLISTIDMSGTVKGIVMVVFVMIAAIFVLLGFLVKKYPMPVCIIGLSLYGSIILLDAFASDNFVLSMIKGILLKIFIISSFIYGILAARKVKQIEADLNQYTNVKLG